MAQPMQTTMRSPSGIGLTIPRQSASNPAQKLHSRHPADPVAAALAMPKANSEELWARGIDWPCVTWIAAVHVLALIAPFYFSWHGLIVCLALIFITGSFGVCMGYHRCLTPGAFQTYRPGSWLLA